MEYITDYKYLGCWVNEFGSDAKTVGALSAGAGRSFGRIIDILRKLGDMGIKTYSTLYESYVLPVANYGITRHPGYFRIELTDSILASINIRQFVTQTWR